MEKKVMEWEGDEVTSWRIEKDFYEIQLTINEVGFRLTNVF